MNQGAPPRAAAGRIRHSPPGEPQPCARRLPWVAALAFLATFPAMLPLRGAFPSAMAEGSPSEPDAVTSQPPRPALTVVLRYDDWCASAALSPKQAVVDLRVLELASLHRVPLSVAVIPAAPLAPRLASEAGAPAPEPPRGGAGEDLVILRRDDKMLEALARASQNAPIEVALHGLHHTSRLPAGSATASEFAGLPYQGQAGLLLRGMALLTEAGLPRPAALVPPWNTYDEATCLACAGAGMRVLSADLDGPPAPPKSGIRLLPETADLGWVKRRDRAVSLAAGLKDPGAVAVVMMHRFDFEECRSDLWPVYARLADLDSLLKDLRADTRIRLATFSEVAAEQGQNLSSERYEAAQAFARRMRVLFGVRLLPYRFLPDSALLSVYWSLPTYQSLNRRALILTAATFGALVVGAGFVSAVLLIAFRRRRRLLWAGVLVAAVGCAAFAFSRPVARGACLGAGLLGLLAPLAAHAAVRRLGRREPANAESMPNAECRDAASDSSFVIRHSSFPSSPVPRPSLFVLGLAALAAALFYEALWLARQPTSGQMAFAVNRLGLRVTLSRAQSEAFAFASAAVAAVVAAAAGVAVWRAMRPAEGAGTRGRLGVRALLGLAILLFLATPLHYAVAWADGNLYGGTVLSSEWGRKQFLREFGLLTPAHLFWLAALACLGGHLLLTRRRWPTALALRVLDAWGRLPRWLAVLGASAVIVVLATAFSLGAQRGIAHFSDATAYYFQAKTFAAGRLSSPLLGEPDFFNPGTCPFPGGMPYAFVGDRWFCVALPFAPLCYAAGFLLGVPWLVAPLLGGAIVVATYFLAREVFGPAAALIALPLAAVSPWLILMSGEYLTHVPGTVAGLVFLLMALRAMARPSWRAAALAGFCLGLAANTRPVTAMGLCGPVAVAWVIWLLRRPAAAWRPSLAFAAGLAVPLAGLLAYNAATTGHATSFAFQVATQQNNLAIQRQLPSTEAAPEWRWRPPLGLANFAESLHGLDRATFRWPVPWLGAALAVLLLLGLGREAKGRGPVLLLALTIPSLALAYVHWARAPEALGGPRYVFEVLPVAVILLAGAVRVVYERLANLGVARERARAVLLGAFVFCVAYGLAGTLTQTLPDLSRFARSNLRLLDGVSAGAERPALVFITVPFGDRFTMKLHFTVSQNDPALAGPLLFARDLGERNRLLIGALPERHYYRWDSEREVLTPLAQTIEHEND